MVNSQRSSHEDSSLRDSIEELELPLVSEKPASSWETTWEQTWEQVNTQLPHRNHIFWKIAGFFVVVFIIISSLRSPTTHSSWKMEGSVIYPPPSSMERVEAEMMPKLHPCSICNCSADVHYFSPSVEFTSLSRPMSSAIWGDGSINVNELMRRNIFDIYCAATFFNEEQSRDMLHSAIKHMPDVMQWNLQGLQGGKPTIYLHTASSPRSKANPFRPQYIQRHAKEIKRWMANPLPGWQVLWTVVEDDTELDPLVARVLRSSGVPYVYYSYGTTNSWGNAQKNAGMQMIFSLSRPSPRGLFGHGPVYGLDDDNFIFPDLLSMLTKVIRVGVFNVGMVSDLEHIYEEMVTFDDQGLVRGTTTPGRKFSFDYGGFTFNSTLLGTVLKAPHFWEFFGWAGESEFLDRILDRTQDLEYLCNRYKNGPDQKCIYAHHNRPLSPEEEIINDPIIAHFQAAMIPKQDH